MVWYPWRKPNSMPVRSPGCPVEAQPHTHTQTPTPSSIAPLLIIIILSPASTLPSGQLRRTYFRFGAGLLLGERAEGGRSTGNNNLRGWVDGWNGYLRVSIAMHACMAGIVGPLDGGGHLLASEVHPEFRLCVHMSPLLSSSGAPYSIICMLQKLGCITECVWNGDGTHGS